MKIGIVGAGNIGTALTHSLTALGHDVAVANSRDPETLGDLVRQTGARAVTAAEAPRGAELVVVTIPQKNVPDLPADLLATTAPGAVVVDTGNYYPQQRDGRIDAIEDGEPESRWVEKLLGHPVVKVFNNIEAAHILTHARPAGAGDRVALPVAADRAEDKRIVLDLVDAMGFDAVDAGSIAQSYRQQPGTPVYGTDRNAEGVRAALAAATPARAPEWSAA